MGGEGRGRSTDNLESAFVEMHFKPRGSFNPSRVCAAGYVSLNGNRVHRADGCFSSWLPIDRIQEGEYSSCKD